MVQSISGTRPMAVPGRVAGSAYLAAAAAVVLLHLSIKRYKLFPTVLMLCFGMQIFAIVGVPIILLIVRCRGGLSDGTQIYSQDPLKMKWLPRQSTLVGYGVVGVCMYSTICSFTELQIWQGSAALECCAFLLLACKLGLTGSTAGMSVRKLLLDAVRLSCRLAASFWLGRRLPRKSGNNFVRACDGCSLLAVCGLLYGARLCFRGASKAEADSVSATVLMLVALALAAVLHFDISHQFLPDTLWTTATYLDVAAPLLQLELAALNGGVVDEAMSHHLAALFSSRLLSLAFWWLIRNTWLRGMTLTGWSILVLGFVQLILLSHYMCYYFRACSSRGLCSGVPLVCAED